MQQPLWIVSEKGGRQTTCPPRFLFLAVPNEERVSRLFRKVLELSLLMVSTQSIIHKIGQDWSSITPATKKMEKKLIMDGSVSPELYPKWWFVGADLLYTECRWLVLGLNHILFSGKNKIQEGKHFQHFLTPNSDSDALFRLLTSVFTWRAPRLHTKLLIRLSK